MFLSCWRCLFLWNRVTFWCHVKGDFPIEVCWFLLWHGRNFVLQSCVEIVFGGKGDLLPNLSMFLSWWCHHFLQALRIFFVASSGSRSFYYFIATLLICLCCCNFFLVPFEFFSLRFFLIVIFFCCLSHCRCWQSIVTWLLFKPVVDIHMVNGLLFSFFLLQLMVMEFLVPKSHVYISKIN